MQHVLVADIGGTKVLLQINTANGEEIIKQRYESRAYSSFEHMLKAFLQQAGDIRIDIASFAIAAPVNGRRVQVTNLPWLIDADSIAEQFGIGRILLCNDFEAVGVGIEALDESQLLTIQAGEPVVGAPRAVLGAGTGLGQAILIEHHSGWQVYPTEGGHADFAPTDDLQIRLLEQLIKYGDRASIERVLSGRGLESIYLFLRDYLQIDETPDLRIAMVNGDAAAAISEYADKDRLAQKAMTMFFTLYGSHAGNVALNANPRQGLYIAGGIAAKNLSWFTRGQFMPAFLNKAPMTHVVDKIPVYVVTEPEVGLLGARLLAEKAMYN